MSESVLISRCLLGEPCRYHGRTTTRWGMHLGRPALVTRLSARYSLIPICPEVDGGMPTPRPPTQIKRGRWICDGKNVTKLFRAGTVGALRLARLYKAKRAYLLKGSPACDPEKGMCACALRKAALRIIGV